VLDDDDGVALVDEAVEHLEELLDVGEVEARGRLVEQVDRAPGGTPRQLGRELDALGLAAGQRRRRLAEMDVAEADVIEGLQLAAHGGDGREDVERLGHGHLQDVGDRSAAIVDLERFAVVALALADLARHVDVRQELHLDLQDAVTLAVLAATALDVEAEPARAVAPDACLGHAGEQLADGTEQSRVRGRVGARRAADGALVDLVTIGGVRPSIRRGEQAPRVRARVAGEARWGLLTSVLLPPTRTPVTM
jgi:hypothetical protein